MTIELPQVTRMVPALALALALSVSASAQTGPSCSQYDTAGLRVGMTTREVWNALDGKGDSIGTASGPSGDVAVVRYTSRDPTVEVEYDRADIGRNRGTLVAVRRELVGDWARNPDPLLGRLGEPTDGAEHLPGGATDGTVEWVDPACRVAVRVWHEPAAWWDPGNAKTWIEIRRLEGAAVPVVASGGTEPQEPAPGPVDGDATSSPAPAPGAATASALPVAIAGTGGVSTPVRIPSSYVAPVYPRIASIAGLDGVVRVQVRIGANGEVLEFLSVDATPRSRGFEEAATAAIRKWRFTPALRDGEPVEVLMPLVVEFQHRP